MSSFGYCFLLGLITYATCSGLQSACPTNACPEGYRCVLETVYCITTPCPPLQRCVPESLPLVKPGRCPEQTGPGACVVNCFGDYLCPGTQKCCGNCPKNCVEPEPEVQRYGRCPPRRLSYGSWCGEINHDCAFDSNCDPGELCCDTGCGQRCTPPVVEQQQWTY